MEANMGKRIGRKSCIMVLVLSLLFSMVDTGIYVKADTSTVIVTPFMGQWKYYGQERELIQDIHYGVSNDEELPDGVSLEIASDEAGKQAYVLEDTRETKTPAYILADNGATYEIKEYKTTAKATAQESVINISDRNELTDDTTVVTAPEGYKISQSIASDAVWKDELNVILTDGINKIEYYLVSNLNDNTKKAIDTTKKVISIQTDWTAPEVVTLTGSGDGDVSAEGQIMGSEPGMFYYVVLPKTVAEEEEGKDNDINNATGGITNGYIENRVASHYGIVGYGRVDGAKPTDFSIDGLVAETEYVLYAYIKDDAGNVSPVKKSEIFTTDKMLLTGEVIVEGTVNVNQILTAKADLDSVSPGELSYQWYRVKNAEDAEAFEEDLDETGGAQEDDLEAEDDDDADEEEDDDEDDDGDDDTYELDCVHALATDLGEDNSVTVDGATLISSATAATYKVTKEDIGYRLICQVKAKNYSGYVAGCSTTYVPKLIPTITLPVISSAVYSPTRKLSSIRLPEHFTWVDSSIVPVYGNSGYRVKYVPENTAIYRTVIVRVKVPVSKKTITKKMIKGKKKYAFTGKSIKNNITVKDGSKKLKKDKDYKVLYKNNKKIGKATVTIKGIGNYRGTKKVKYNIVKCSVKSLTYRYKKTKVYTGKTLTASVTVKNDSVKLIKNKDYTIVYRNNVALGTATVTIKGKGNYKGKKILHFQIVPSKPKITKVTKKSTSFRLQLSSEKVATGYYIYVSETKTFSKKKTQRYLITGNRFGMQGLVKGTYYVRVKCYGIKKGNVYKSSYSKVRKIKIK